MVVVASAVGGDVVVSPNFELGHHRRPKFPMAFWFCVGIIL
jgi:hypothetical protein